MLQEDQVTSAPSSRRVSISTAVCNKNHIKNYEKSVILDEFEIFKFFIQTRYNQLITWTVMCRQPAILAPFRGFEGPYFFLEKIEF